ncbi:hypothetical protein PVAP13_6NG077430 [Panicum virgatum]|uniref:Uncharacterized protein n=1 Tax=Panicum virgatum TaxID=38727 RepID=A0A8T0QVE1_PANVG|nr:hypothetical protein PVAP13_6NG077430 [Panicum virgatum]
MRIGGRRPCLAPHILLSVEKERKVGRRPTGQETSEEGAASQATAATQQPQPASTIKQRRKPPSPRPNATRRRKPQPRRRRPLHAGAAWGFRPPPPRLATGDHRRARYAPSAPARSLLISALRCHASFRAAGRAAGHCGASSAPGPGPLARPARARGWSLLLPQKRQLFFSFLFGSGRGFCELARPRRRWLVVLAFSSLVVVSKGAVVRPAPALGLVPI